VKYKAITFYINNASTPIGVFRLKYFELNFSLSGKCFCVQKLLPENVNSLKETWGEKNNLEPGDLSPG